MKTYKLWVEIEEYNLQTGEHQSLTDQGAFSPVPIADFPDLESAVRFAEALGVDGKVKDIFQQSPWN